MGFRFNWRLRFTLLEICCSGRAILLGRTSIFVLQRPRRFPSSVYFQRSQHQPKWSPRNRDHPRSYRNLGVVWVWMGTTWCWEWMDLQRRLLVYEASSRRRTSYFQRFAAGDL